MTRMAGRVRAILPLGCARICQMALKRRLVLTVRLDRTYPDNEVRLRTNDTSWLARLD
jgi:hypothetical protein